MIKQIEFLMAYARSKIVDKIYTRNNRPIKWEQTRRGNDNTNKSKDTIFQESLILPFIFRLYHIVILVASAIFSC